MSTAEWKEGYRDGLTAAIKVTQTVADEAGTTSQDVLLLLETLVSSHVLDPTPEDYQT